MENEVQEPEPLAVAEELVVDAPTPTEQEAFDAGFGEDPEKEIHPTAAEKAAAAKTLGAASLPAEVVPVAEEDHSARELAALAEKYKDGADMATPPAVKPAPEPRREVVAGSLTERLSKAFERETDDFGGQKVNVKEFEEDFKEEAAYIKSSIMAAVTPILKEIEDKASEMQELRYWSAIQDAHPGAKKIAASKEFNDWLETQPEPIKRASLTLNSADAITILDAYHATTLRSAKEQSKQAAAAAKAKTDKLHGGSLRGSSPKAVSTTKTSNAGSDDEFGDAFAEAAK